jgi:hypothetical protein
MEVNRAQARVSMVMTELSERREGVVCNGLKIRLDEAPSHNGAMARHCPWRGQHVMRSINVMLGSLRSG